MNLNLDGGQGASFMTRGHLPPVSFADITMCATIRALDAVCLRTAKILDRACDMDLIRSALFVILLLAGQFKANGRPSYPVSLSALSWSRILQLHLVFTFVFAATTVLC